MKITDLFEIYSGKGEYTEEYIEWNRGPYPLISGQTENNGVIGHINTYDFDFDECLTYAKDGEKSGIIFMRSGKFSLTSHANALVVKEKFKSDIILEWFKYKYQPIFIKNVIGKFGNPSLPQVVLKRIDINIPEKEIQGKELKQFQNYEKNLSELKEKFKKIETIINDSKHTTIRIPKKEVLTELNGKILFDILPKNFGLTEKCIYDKHNPTKEELPVFNGSENIWGFIPKDSRVKNKPVRTCKGNIIIIVRKGYAGKIFLQDKYDECIVAEDAIPVRIKNKYQKQLNVNWFIREYQFSFVKHSTGKFSSATFSQKTLNKMRFKIPSMGFQVKCSKLYAELDKKIDSLSNKIEAIKIKLCSLRPPAADLQ